MSREAPVPDTVPITLPSMGESVAEGTVSRWLKAVGDRVEVGEALVEVTTDKVDIEVPSPSAGTLESIAAIEGATVEVGATLGTVTPGAAGKARSGKNGNSTGKPAVQIPPKSDDEQAPGTVSVA